MMQNEAGEWCIRMLGERALQSATLLSRLGKPLVKASEDTRWHKYALVEKMRGLKNNVEDLIRSNER